MARSRREFTPEYKDEAVKLVVTRPSAGVTLDDANQLIQHACLAAAELEIPMAFVVVDAAGHLVSSARMDGGRWFGFDIALGKAYTAAAFAEPTHIRAQKASALPQFTSALTAMSSGKYIPQDGGFPLIRDGMLFGGIGASGGIGEEDDAVLLPALAAIGYDHQ